MKKILSFFVALMACFSLSAQVNDYAEIVFSEAIAADALAEEASFTVPGTEFALTIHDAGNKMAIDANDCRFGPAEAYTMYNFR